MIQTGLEFAPGTTDDCKRLVQGLVKPDDLFAAYRQGRASFETGDLVVVVSERDASGAQVTPRKAYVKQIRQAMGSRGAKTLHRLTIASKSAHSIAKLPFDSDAMWLIIARGNQNLPVECVVFAVKYEAGDQVVAPGEGG